MNRKWIASLIMFFILVIIVAYSRKNDFPILKNPYLGQKPPGMIPEVFAPGVVSTDEYTELGCTFSPDGKYLFYNSISDTGKNSDIFWVDAKITEKLKPVNLK